MSNRRSTGQKVHFTSGDNYAFVDALRQMLDLPPMLGAKREGRNKYKMYGDFSYGTGAKTLHAGSTMKSRVGSPWGLANGTGNHIPDLCNCRCKLLVFRTPR